MTKDELREEIEYALRLGSGKGWFDNGKTTEALLALIDAYTEQRVADSYRKGYNDNARDCLCGKFTVKPHRHLIDDGKSYDIKLDISTLKGDKE